MSMNTSFTRQNRLHWSRLFCCALLLTAASTQPLFAAPLVNSVQTDQEANQIRLVGSGLNGINVSVNGTPISLGTDSTDSTAILNSAELVDVIFIGMNVFSVNGGPAVLFYSGFNVQTPPAPPPPGPISPDCPCLTGWKNAGLTPYADIFLCPESITGSKTTTTGISYTELHPGYSLIVSFDPNDNTFNSSDVVNSGSACGLHNGTSWIVAEPVLSQEQYDSCFNWLWFGDSNWGICY